MNDWLWVLNLMYGVAHIGISVHLRMLDCHWSCV